MVQTAAPSGRRSDEGHLDAVRRLLADVGHQSHESGSLDRGGHRMLAGSSATTFSPANDPALAIDHLLQQLDVLVINVHRAWTMAIDEDWVLLPGAGADS